MASKLSEVFAVRLTKVERENIDSIMKQYDLSYPQILRRAIACYKKHLVEKGTSDVDMSYWKKDED